MQSALKDFLQKCSVWMEICFSSVHVYITDTNIYSCELSVAACWSTDKLQAVVAMAVKVWDKLRLQYTGAASSLSLDEKDV